MRVVVVEPEADRLEEISSWLRADGWFVWDCPGPSAPDYSCPGGSKEGCPLAEQADVVVLDLWLEGDTFLEGTAGWELLTYYLSLGKPVVALEASEDPLRPLPGELIEVLPRPPEREPLLRAARELYARTSRAGTRKPADETLGADFALARPFHDTAEP